MKKIGYTLMAGFVALTLVASCGTEPQDQNYTPSLQTKEFDLSFLNFFWETFENYEPGSSAPDSYIWMNGGASLTENTELSPARGNMSLKVEIEEDSTDRDYIGVKFCLNNPMADILMASFYIKFHSLVNWNGIGVLGDEDNMQYWWWIRSDGTVFNDHTFDAFMANVWHKVTITIDRNSNTATFDLDGNKNYFDLNLDWIHTDPNQPMQCIFALLGVFDTPQAVQIDHVTMLGF